MFEIPAGDCIKQKEDLKLWLLTFCDNDVNSVQNGVLKESRGLLNDPVTPTIE